MPESINNHYSKPPESAFITKTSEKKDQFPSGAIRDSEEGKPRYDLIPPLALKRVADLYFRGIKNYGVDNWSKGMNYRRLYSSLMRHVMQFGEGDKTEDHLAAVCWNALAIMHFQENGRVDLDDMPNWKSIKNEQNK